jgi:tetratricopeptide (TPR) repeat protein
VRALVLVLLAPLLVGFDLLQSPNRAVEDGNARLKAGKAEEALSHYDKAVKALATEPGAHFDRGAALFALSRFEESVPEFLRATEAKTPALKEAAFYNLGNGLFKLETYGDAIAAYRRALGLDPNDVRAKWNLELALKKKKDQEEKEKEKKDQQSKDDKNKKDQQPNDDKQEKKDEQAKQDDNGKQDKKEDQKKQDEQAKQDEQSKKDGKQPEQPKDNQKNQASADKDKDKDKKEQGEGVNPNTPPPSDKGQDMREIEAVLDSLERSPKDLEKERAQARAIRRAPPRKNW